MTPTLLKAWLDIREQWVANARLRVGSLLVFAILWIYALLLGDDYQARLNKDAAGLRAELQLVQPMASDTQWRGRLEDATQRLQAVRSMMWGEGDLGLAEAALQDWLRLTATKTRLPLRDLQLSRGEEATRAKRMADERWRTVKVRMTADFDRTALLAFLSEIGRSERVLVAERLLMRPGTVGQLVEIDIRSVAAMSAEGAP